MELIRSPFVTSLIDSRVLFCSRGHVLAIFFRNASLSAIDITVIALPLSVGALICLRHEIVYKFNYMLFILQVVVVTAVDEEEVVVQCVVVVEEAETVVVGRDRTSSNLLYD